jgi:hypothetical protein
LFFIKPNNDAIVSTAGNSAAQGLHLAPESGTIITGSLANGGFIVSLGGAALITGTATYTFATYTDNIS